MDNSVRSTLSSMGASTGSASAAAFPEPTGTIGGAIPFSLHYLVGEIASALAIVGVMMDYLPKLVTLMALVWYAILIFESQTFRKIASRRVKAEAVAARVIVLEDAQVAKELLAEAADAAKDSLAGDLVTLQRISEHD